MTRERGFAVSDSMRRAAKKEGYCFRCGQEVSQDTVFCPRCGQVLGDDAPPVPPEPGRIQTDDVSGSLVPSEDAGSRMGRAFSGSFGAGIGWAVGGCVGLLILGAVLFVGCAALIAVGGSDKSDVKEESKKQDTPAKLEPYVISGSGQSTSEAFNLVPGLRTFAVEYEGSGKYEYFSVELLNQDGSGRESEFLFTEMLDSGQPFTGSEAAQIRGPGVYVLQVKANGPWQVTIT